MLAGAAPPDEWLAAIPLIQDWRLPGLVLAAGFGAGSHMVDLLIERRFSAVPVIDGDVPPGSRQSMLGATSDSIDRRCRCDTLR